MSLFEFKTPDVDTARRFVDVCITTGKFARAVDSKILWGTPGDYVHLQRWQEFYWIIVDGQAFEYRGATDDETVKFLWKSLENQKFRLPRAGMVQS
jgi:hypothetical protein